MYDLHTHSACSDGELSPSALVDLAKSRGITTLALTDHDTVAGLIEAQRAAGDDLRIIQGIEFSSLWNGHGIHIVGLQIDMASPVLQAAVAQQQQSRFERARAIAQRLEKVGIQGAWEGVQYYAKDAVIGRPHFAQYLVDTGYVNSFAQAFKRYLGTGKPGDIKQCWSNIETVVQWIRSSGGIAVLAHPDKYGMTHTKLYHLLEDFVAIGGHALEVVSGQQDSRVTDKLYRAAKDFSLLASCGSDFHALGQGRQPLGQYSPMPEGCQPVWEYFS
ncbi:phosphatase [Candidatus Endobugula sertula]|uniref:Phosphatase n=1 Tax=Candidatus Endobugula sertula TaxID=62101 RepID=A0A1D2QR99_9GAMM|nr:phosphatase [Candidatus Endobugula sertula]